MPTQTPHTIGHDEREAEFELSSSTSASTAGRYRAGPRWALLTLALMGLVGIYLLSGHDSAGGHRIVVPTAGSSASILSDPVAGANDTTATASLTVPTGDGHAILAGCALLLLAAAAMIVLAALGRGRPFRRRPRASLMALTGLVRGPPMASARLALCVERI